MDIDYLIIGQGLAGSLLGWELIQSGQKVLIVDNGEENASQVAAGLINPVTGMRFVKVAEVDWLLKTARQYYANLEHFFQQRFYYEKTMLRLLRNQKELQTAEKRLTQNDYQDYLAKIIAPLPDINSPLGLLQQKQTGYLLTQPLLSVLKQFFINQQRYIKTTIDYRQIHLKPQLQWQNIKPQQIIFCEGYQAVNNPWFNGLPFQPVKGEIVTAETSESLIQNIFNYGHWFIPLNKHRFKTGATFDRENLNTQTTLEAQNNLMSALHQVYPTLQQSSVIKLQAGIRPATSDRQPFIGHHPEHSRLAIFNGFGAKGSLQIPFYCQQFAKTLQHNGKLPDNCNITRYYESHFPA